MPPPVAAVITGDLIASTGHRPAAVEAAMQRIAAAAADIAGWPGGRPTRFTRFRGDGWQICLAPPHLCLRAALVIAARLRAGDGGDGGLATRLSIAVGTADSFGSRDLSDAAGEVFRLSGRALDAMPRSGRIALSGPAIGARDQIIARQMFERAGRWTPPQAEAAALYLQPGNPTLADLAAPLGVTPQAVNYRLGGAGAATLRTNLQLWEEVIENELARSGR